MSLYGGSPASIPYREVLEVGNRLEKAWKERKAETFLTKIEHRPVRRPISNGSASDRPSLMCASPQVTEAQLPISCSRKSISSARSVLESPLYFRQYTLADPPLQRDSMVVIGCTNGLQNSSVSSPLVPLHALTPPTNSTVEWKGSPCESLVVSTPLRQSVCVNNTSHQVTKPASVPRPPRVYSISTRYSLPHNPSTRAGCSPLDPAQPMDTTVSESKQIPGRKGQVPGPATYEEASLAKCGPKSPITMCTTKATGIGHCSRVSQHVPLTAKSPLARPQALLPFNPRRTAKQFRQEIMALGPPPEVKPMVMTASCTRNRPRVTQYDLATKGASNLLRFDRLEFRVHRPPSTGAGFVTGAYHSNGVPQKPLRPHSIKRTDITGRNVVITEFDADSQNDADVLFSNLLDVR